RVLRRIAGDEKVRADRSQVALARDAAELDLVQFEELAGAEDWGGAARHIKGGFLEGFGIPEASEFEDWLTAERHHWRRRSVSVLLAKAEVDSGFGNLRGAVEAAHRALSLDPDSEPALRTVMRSLALGGDRADALGQFAAFATRLQETAGAQPDAETRALAERVRRQWKSYGSVPRPPRGEPETRRTPLIGREGELHLLLDTWAACRDGRRAAVVVVEGDTGLGKTRLLEEALARARLDGATVASVRAVEADLGEPWSGVISLARGGLLDAVGLPGAAPSALAAFAEPVPEWGERFAAAVRDKAPAPMGRALSEVLRAIAEEQPTCVAVDDAQWLDGESLRGLLGSARDLARAPVLVLCAMTPVPPRPEFDDLRSRLGRDLPGTAIRLSPLTPEAVRGLAGWALPHFNDIELDRVTRRVVADSAGLPLLVVELLHAVRLGLNLEDAADAWPQPNRTLDQSLPGDLPDSVVAAVRIGFRRLSPTAQQALAAAAVLGDRVMSPILARGSGLEPGLLETALDELEWQRWLVAEPRGYSFLARIVREVIARDMLTPGQRQRIVERSGSSA
ncbi:MAG: AAA family ATPase, partial [Gemmatimonadales bacterium]